MADAKVKISSLTSAPIIGNSDLIPIVQNGVTKKLEFSVIRNLISTGDFLKGTFDNSDLTSGVLTINHNRGTVDIFVFIFNPDGWIQIVPYKVSDINNILVDFGGAGSSIDAGDWTYYLVFYNGSSSSSTADITKAFEIGEWNMDTTATKEITFTSLGIDFSKVKHISCTIKMDVGVEEFFIDRDLNLSGNCGWGFVVGDIDYKVYLSRTASGIFDNPAFSGSGNRGYLVITYAI